MVDRCKVEEPPLGEVGPDQVARCWVLMRNVSDSDVATAKASSISIAAAQKLKAPVADAEAGSTSSTSAGG